MLNFRPTGQYTLRVRNEAGERSVTIKVKVLDVASKVRYLTVEDISANACTLTWDTPDDDGACEITNYVVEKRQVSQVNWTQINADLTVRFLRVDHLMKNEDYLFRFGYKLWQNLILWGSQTFQPFSPTPTSGRHRLTRRSCRNHFAYY